MVRVAAEDGRPDRRQAIRFGGDRALVVERPGTAPQGKGEAHTVLGGSGPVPPLHTEPCSSRQPVDSGCRDRRPRALRGTRVEAAPCAGEFFDRSELSGQLQHAAVGRVLREHDGAERGVRIRGDAATRDRPVAEDRTRTRPGRRDMAEEGEISDQVGGGEVVAGEGRVLGSRVGGSGYEHDAGIRSHSYHRRLESHGAVAGEHGLRAPVTDHEHAGPVDPDIQPLAVHGRRAHVVDAPLQPQAEARHRAMAAGRSDDIDRGREVRARRGVRQAVERTVGCTHAAHEAPVRHTPVLKPIAPVLGPGPVHVRPLVPAADEAGLLSGQESGAEPL